MIARARIQESIVERLALHPRVGLLGLRQCGKTTLARPVALGAGARIFDLENPDYVACSGKSHQALNSSIAFSTFHLSLFLPSAIRHRKWFHHATHQYRPDAMSSQKSNASTKGLFWGRASLFWFRHRNDCIRELVRNFQPKGKVPIFDVGGGNGFLTWNV